MVTDDTRIIDLTVSEFRKLLREEIAKSLQLDLVPNVNPVDTIPIEKLSELLGWSKSTIYKKCSLRQIPHFKVGKELRFDIEEINQWISQGKRKTAEEVVSEFELKNRKHLRKIG
jgi:excisionase family DNA binding protein